MRTFVLGLLFGLTLVAGGVLATRFGVTAAGASPMPCNWMGAVQCWAISGGFECDQESMPLPDHSWAGLPGDHELQMQWVSGTAKFTVAPR